MRIQPYSVRSLWSGALKGLFARKPSFFTTSLLAPAVFWLLVSVSARLRGNGFIQVGLPLAALVPLAAVSASLVARATTRDKRNQTIVRRAALVNSMYFAGFLFTLSGYFLRLAIELGTGQSGLADIAPAVAISIYALSALVSAAWAPFSLPRSQEDDAVAARRELTWLPWVMGCQGLLVGAGVFIGAWFLHGDVPWEGLFIVGSSTLAAVLLVTVAVLGLYRFAVLSLHPIPPDVLDEMGIQG